MIKEVVKPVTMVACIAKLQTPNKSHRFHLRLASHQNDTVLLTSRCLALPSLPLPPPAIAAT